MLVAIEGIDGSGKGTQAQRLVSALQCSGLRACLLSFPRYRETAFGRRVGEFLNGRFGALREVHPLLVSLLFAGDRFESRPVLREAIAANDVVILDRYVASNVAHQTARVEGDERRELRAWIEQLEFGLYELPQPGLVILFDLEVHQAQQLIARKARRSYTNRSADLHEADGRYLERVRQVYLQLAADDPAWQTIAVFRNDQVRPADEIGAEVESTVRAVLGRHT
jgi:dTMP kinase